MPLTQADEQKKRRAAFLLSANHYSPITNKITIIYKLLTITIRSVLRLEYRAGLVDFQGVPSHWGNLDAVLSFAGADAVAGHLGELTLVQRALPVVYGAATVHRRQLLVEDGVEAALESNDGL